MSDELDYTYEPPCEYHQSAYDALAALSAPPPPDPDLAVRVTERLQQRVAELEAENARLRRELPGGGWKVHDLPAQGQAQENGR